MSCDELAMSQLAANQQQGRSRDHIATTEAGHASASVEFSWGDKQDWLPVCFRRSMPKEAPRGRGVRSRRKASGTCAPPSRKAYTPPGLCRASMLPHRTSVRLVATEWTTGKHDPFHVHGT